MKPESSGADETDEGRIVGLSSTEDAVDGLLSLLLVVLCGSLKRGADVKAMCGAVAVRLNETSLSARDGADADDATSGALDGLANELRTPGSISPAMLTAVGCIERYSD